MPDRGPDVLSPLISHLVSASPLQAGVLATTIRDLALAVEWIELRPLLLPGTEWVAVLGRKRRSDPLRAVLPLPLHTTSLTPQQLSSIFKSLGTLSISDLPEPLPRLAPSLDELRVIKAQREAARRAARGEEKSEEQGAEVEEESVKDDLPADDTFDGDTLYVAIGTTDSTIVYYKLSRGIKKPADIPDE